MRTNYVPLVADSFLFCYEKDFMMSLSNYTQADITEAFTSISKCLDGLLNIDNSYFEIYPNYCSLTKLNLLIPKRHFYICFLLISNGFVSSNIYDKRVDFDFGIVKFPIFRMVKFLVPLPMVFTFLNLFGLPEYNWLTAMFVTKRWLPNFYNWGIGIINVGKFFFQSFIVQLRIDL